MSFGDIFGVEKKPVTGVQGKAYAQRNPIVPADTPGHRFKLYREPFTDYFVVTCPDGTSEELTVEETRMFFYQRGADMQKLEKAYDYAWEFSCLRDVFFVIENYREPIIRRGPADPQV